MEDLFSESGTGWKVNQENLTWQFFGKWNIHNEKTLTHIYQNNITPTMGIQTKISTFIIVFILIS